MLLPGFQTISKTVSCVLCIAMVAKATLVNDPVTRCTESKGLDQWTQP